MFLLFAIAIHSLLILANAADNETGGNRNETYNILVVLPGKESRLDSFGLTIPKVKPVIDTALSDLVDAEILPKNFLHFSYFDSKYYVNSFTAERLVTVKVFKEYFANNLNALLGFADSYTLATVAKVTAGLPGGIPIITTAGCVSALAVKTEYPYLTRMQGSWDQLAAGIYNFLKIEKHSETALYNIGFLFHDRKRSPNAKKFSEENEISSNCFFAMHSIKQYFVEHNKNYREKWRRYIPTSIFDEVHLDSKTIRKLLKEITAVANTIFLCGSPITVRNIIQEAKNLEFILNGKYSFFSIEVGTSNISENLLNINDSDITVLQLLKIIGFRRSYNDKYYFLQKRIKEKAEAIYKYSITQGKPYVLNDFVASFYDAVMLYGHSLNRSLAQTNQIQNASVLTKNMWTLAFEGINGHVLFNQRGDRIMETALYSYSPIHNKFVEVAAYSNTSNGLQILDDSLYKKSLPRIDSVCDRDNAKSGTSKPKTFAMLKLLGVVALLLAFFGTWFLLINRNRALSTELANLKSYKRDYAQNQYIEAEKNAFRIWKKSGLMSSPLIKIHISNDGYRN